MTFFAALITFVWLFAVGCHVTFFFALSTGVREFAFRSHVVTLALETAPFITTTILSFIRTICFAMAFLSTLETTPLGFIFFFGTFASEVTLFLTNTATFIIRFRGIVVCITTVSGCSPTGVSSPIVSHFWIFERLQRLYVKLF
jgi:hypothetical protein